MKLSIRDYTIVRVVQATHHQGDVRYGASRGTECSCISLISVSWKLFKYPGLWNNFYLDYILGKGEYLFKFINKFRYLWMEDSPQEFLIENFSVNVEFLENKTGEILLGYICYYYKNCIVFRKLGLLLYLLLIITFWV